jgi:hypothetical protein
MRRDPKEPLMSWSINRPPVIAAAAMIALALPISAMARPGGGGGGGHGGGGGGHIGGGSAHVGGAHFSAPSFSRGPVSFSRSAAVSRSFSRSTFHTSRSFSAPHVGRVGTLHNAGITHVNRSTAAGISVRNAHVVAGAALAHGVAWHNAWHWQGHANWWRHRAFFGWAGPLYWPYFYDDLWYDVFWSWGPDYYEDPFWAYGYGDIYGAMFSPYGSDDLAGWAPPPRLASTGSIARNTPSQQPPATSQPALEFEASRRLKFAQKIGIHDPAFA